MKNIILLLLFFYFGVEVSRAQPGNTDAGFGINGIVKADIGKSYFIGNSGFKVLLDKKGDIFVIATASGNAFITKRHSNGGLDSTYGKNGFSAIVLMAGGDATIQPDDKIIIVGAAGFDLGLARFNPNGSLDSTFSGDGILISSFAKNSNATAVALQPDGKIVVAGGVGLARYFADGRMDSSFSGILDDVIGLPKSLYILRNGKILVSGPLSTNNGFALSRYNADGTLDTAFGEKGKQIISFSGNIYYYSSIVQNDGKIIVAGIVTIYNYPFDSSTLTVARYNGDGSLDSTFGVYGKQRVGVGKDLFYIQTVIALQNDKKIIVGTDTALFRFNSNGSIDSTFSEDGKITAYFKANNSVAKAIAIQKDGKIIVSADAPVLNYTARNFGLSRFNTDGSTDNTFKKNGVFSNNLKQGNTVYKSTAVQKDGKIVAAGYTWNGENFIFALTRYLLNGTMDSSFSGDGVKTTSFGPGNDYGNSVAIQADGKIVVAGSASHGKKRVFAFARYSVDGEPDLTFSDDGKQEIAFGTAGRDSAIAVAIQADGKIVAVGATKNSAALVRLNVNGDLDATFGGGDGKQTLGNSYSCIATSVAIQKDGKIVIAGNFEYFALARYSSNGFPDKTFAYNGLATGNFKYHYRYVNALTIQDDGKILAAANVSYLEEANTFVVARYTNLGWMDNSFGTFGRFESDGYQDYVNSLVIESDGKIVAAGQREDHSAVTRININGSLDSSFGFNGRQVLRLSGYKDDIYGLAIGNNSLYAAGACQCPGNLGTVIKYQLTANATLPLKIQPPARPLPVSDMIKEDRNRVTGGLALFLSPNPVAGMLIIRTAGFLQGKVARVSVISPSGMIMKTIQTNSSTQIQPDVSSLASGTYILKFFSGNEVLHKWFVKG